MSRRIGQRASRGVIAATALALLVPIQAAAQGGDGYLLKRPRVTLKFETGYGFQRANSDIFDFVVREHTLGRRDFDSPYLGGEFALRVSEHVDLGFSVGYHASSRGSEFRDWVDQDDLPITQVTELTQVPAVVGVRYFPFPRGRMLGRFAWVPRKISPYVGAGVGVVSYSFEQYGDFVDFSTYEIFTDDFTSRDDGLLLRLQAGVNVSLGHQFLFSMEGRYARADARMNQDFVGFDRIDLDGFQLVGGLGVRF